jgi:hypothetical protein
LTFTAARGALDIAKTVDFIAAQWQTKGSQFSPLTCPMAESQNTPPHQLTLALPFAIPS